MGDMSGGGQPPPMPTQEPALSEVVATVSAFSDRGLLMDEEPTVNHKPIDRGYPLWDGQMTQWFDESMTQCLGWAPTFATGAALGWWEG